jgi:hypothetical protein
VPLQPVVDGRPVIVHLASRDHVVSITAGPNGPAVLREDERRCADRHRPDAPATQEQHPEVYKRLQPAIAPAATVDASDRGPILIDASIGRE